MATHIQCPNCHHEFPLQEALTDEMNNVLEQEKKSLREQMLAFIEKQKVENLEKDKENEQFKLKQANLYQEKLKEETLKAQKEAEEIVRKSVANAYENKIRLFEENEKENKERIKLANEKELMYMRKEQEMQRKEEQAEIDLQLRLNAERLSITDEVRKAEEQRMQSLTAQKETEYQMKLKEMEQRMDAQQKLVEEMRRKAEQGSMQLQGEVQELALEELLHSSFPFDQVQEVGKGVRGADCILTVRNEMGQECGKIMYESKRTQSFSNDWIEKLKADMRSEKADIAVIVTQTMPKDLNQFGEKDGVWICTFTEVKALTSVLRDGIKKVYRASQNEDQKTDKMTLLYDYLTSNVFLEQWKAISEGFQSMQNSIQIERNAMEKLWKNREKQLEKVLLNVSHFRGSIQGISNSNISLSGFEDDLLLGG